MRHLLLAGLLFLGACAKTPTRSAAFETEECTGATPLKADIPGSPGHLIPSALNPNGASELATLMRRFVEDYKTVQGRIKAGQPIDPLTPAHRRIRCSWPTTPSDRNPTFDAFAITYLANVSALEAKPSKETYDGVIQACAACHGATCNGPLTAIDALAFDGPGTAPGTPASGPSGSHAIRN